MKAAREREERRADQANLGAVQETLRRLTRAQRRRFGIVAGGGGSAGVNPSLVAAALAGSGLVGGTGGLTGGGGGTGGTAPGGGGSIVDFL